jgi:hypothetical protein
MLANVLAAVGGIASIAGCGSEPVPMEDGVDEPEVASSALTQGQLYHCPVLLSSSCDDASKCESTCMGQVTYNSTCTTYGHNAVPTNHNCTTTSFGSQSFWIMPTILSQSCSSTSNCQSECDGQLADQYSACGYWTSGGYAGGGGHNQSGTLLTGAQHLYSCPVVPSVSCSDVSKCESFCLGQVTTLNRCAWRSHGGVVNYTNCTDLGIVTL